MDITMSKKVLVIGNGFDKAHNLKTNYNDYLSFIRERSWEDYKIESDDAEAIESEFVDLCARNAFINYFIDYSRDIDYWVDFESEMRKISLCVYKALNKIPEDHHNNIRIKENLFTAYEIKCLRIFNFISDRLTASDVDYILSPVIYTQLNGINWKQVKRTMSEELTGLKRSLIIYLKYYMPLCSVCKNKIPQIEAMNPDEIITFNYTDTYNLYGYDAKKVIHVHGDLNSEKIVLGYDDLDEDNLVLVDFKKYFQRIQNKHLAVIERFFADSGKGDKEDKTVLVYGLSLDRTDEDMIKTIYRGSSVFNVYYLDDYDYANKVTNLIAILGKRKFLEGYQSERICFFEIERTAEEES